MRFRPADDRGASLVEYAMLVLLIALGSLGLVANLGHSTSDSFDSAAGALAPAGTETDPELTPQEKWDQARDDYKQAIEDARAQRKTDLAEAKADYKAALEANKSLPKLEKKKANAEAKTNYKTSRTKVNDTYKAAVQTAKDAKAEAKAEYQASR
jgi:Flp pilus assembly pilin Flp